MIELLLKIWYAFESIYSELKIRDIRFDIDGKKSEESETIASVCADCIVDTTNDNEHKDDKDRIFKVKFESTIKIYENYLDLFINDLANCLDKRSDKITELLKIASLENAIVHELQHIHQFITVELTIDNIDIITNEEDKTFGFVINKETHFALEKDANDYMLSKSNITMLNDKELKLIMSNLEYNNISINMYRDLLLGKIEDNEDTSVEDEAILKYKNEVKKWVDILNTHINEKY